MTLLADLAAVSDRVAATSSRLAKVRELADFLRLLVPDEVAIAVSYLTGETRQGKLGVAYAQLQAARTAPADAPGLSVIDVDRAFEALATVSGKGSSARRAEALRSLLAQSTAAEQDFLARLIVGELRQGALQGVMADAIASAAGLEAATVRRAIMSAGGLAEVAAAAIAEGRAGLERFSIRLLHPVLPMLSQSAEDTGAALKALGIAAFEWKLDGARVQVHKAGGDVHVYTRNLNDVTARVPEVVELVQALPAASLILDGEVIALRPDGTPHPFQLTMRRFGRRLAVEETRRELPLSVFFFDCLYRDGEPLVERRADERFDALCEALPHALVIPRLVTGETAAAATFMDEAIAHGHEGVMAKALDAPYEAGRRGAGWLKVKRANTLDLVILAAEWGSGRREGWLSNLHLGARDPEHGGYVMLGKTFKGLTDDMLRWQTQALLERETRREQHVVHVRPEIVVEIAFNEVQESSQYPGGLALRFARVKGYRPDKSPADADTIAAVRAIHARSIG